MSTLVVGVPFSGKPLPPSQTLCFTNFITQLPMNYNMRQYHTQGAPIDEARNFFAQNALECGAKYLFFWDEDVVVPSYIMRQLIYRMEHNPEIGMVGGVYCQKVEPVINCAPMVFRGHGQGPYWKWRVGDFFEVDAIGTGASMIRVEALKDIEKPWFKTEKNYDSWLDGVPKGEEWTEDLWFCHRLKETKKWKIYADGSLVCGHMDLDTRKVYGLPPDSYPMRRMGVEKGRKKIVDLGCGPHKYQTDEGEVIGVDIREEVKPDYCLDLHILPFATGEFDIVYSSHTLEHFAREEIESIFDEWVRILKRGGIFRLIVPNIEWAADRIKQGVVDHDVLNVLYGQQEYSRNFHKTGFTPDMIRAMFEKRGFAIKKMELKYYNIIVEALKKVSKKQAA